EAQVLFVPLSAWRQNRFPFQSRLISRDHSADRQQKAIDWSKPVRRTFGEEQNKSARFPRSDRGKSDWHCDHHECCLLRSNQRRQRPCQSGISGLWRSQPRSSQHGGNVPEGEESRSSGGV